MAGLTAACGCLKTEMKYDGSKPIGQRVCRQRRCGRRRLTMLRFIIATNSFRCCDGGDGFAAFTEGRARRHTSGGYYVSVR
ncbi:hypothetical protein KCP78_20825 [Salmonella enterica subsp. enterica]|nr:hypothetical protein KCP78_20825 [Salmonella enterica subsp. enterica]